MAKDSSQNASAGAEIELAGKMKLGMRRWASGVSVIATRDSAGEPFAMTVSSLTSVSDSPPSLLVCINQNAKMAAILEVVGAKFSANLLGSEHQFVSNACSSPDMQGKRFTLGSWDMSGVPRLLDAPAVFDCEVASVTPFGTHLVVIGKIGQVFLNEAAKSPLCYWNGGYRELMID